MSTTGKGKVVINRLMSLDGFIAGPGGSMDWEGGHLAAQVYASWTRDHYSDPGELSAGAWDTHDTTRARPTPPPDAQPKGIWPFGR